MAKPILLLLGALAAAVLLASCGDMPVKVPDQVMVNVPVACIPAGERPQKPAVRTEADLWALDEYHRTLAAWSDLKKLRDEYLPLAEATLEGCSRLPAAAQPLERGTP